MAYNIIVGVMFLPLLWCHWTRPVLRDRRDAIIHSAAICQKWICARKTASNPRLVREYNHAGFVKASRLSRDVVVKYNILLFCGAISEMWCEFWGSYWRRPNCSNQIPFPYDEFTINIVKVYLYNFLLRRVFFMWVRSWQVVLFLEVDFCN